MRSGFSPIHVVFTQVICRGNLIRKPDIDGHDTGGLKRTTMFVQRFELQPKDYSAIAVEKQKARGEVCFGKLRKGKDEHLKSAIQEELFDLPTGPVKNESIDMVLTSPPYLNAIDYIRCSKFSLVWMGHDIASLRRLRAGSIGTESAMHDAPPDKQVLAIIASLSLKPKLTPRQEAVLLRYLNDMRLAIEAVVRVLKPGGMAIYVVGENTIQGTYIPNSVMLRSVAESAGLKLMGRSVRNLPANRRYLPPPGSRRHSAAFESRMRREVILRFRKNG